MEVEFRTTVDDYVAFYRYFFFRRKLTVRIVGWGIVCLIIGNAVNPDNSVLSWTFILAVLASALAVILFLFVIPYKRAIRRFQKAVEGRDKVDQHGRVILTADGFDLQWLGKGMEDQPSEHYRMESIKAVEATDGYVIVLLFHHFPLVIPKAYFPADDAISNFIGRLNYGMIKIKASGQESDKVKANRVAYWGLLGFLPNFGAITGFVLIILGIVRYKSRKLIIIGVADILFTVFFWAVFMYWMTNNSIFKSSMKQFSKGQLNTVFKSVEFYKLRHGHYPDSLREIMDPNGMVFTTDPILHKGMKTVEFYYQKTGDKYWLFSVGDDGKPFTADDIFPTMEPADSAKFGLRLR